MGLINKKSDIPSGFSLTQRLGKSPCWVNHGKSTISMAMFSQLLQGAHVDAGLPPEFQDEGLRGHHRGECHAQGLGPVHHSDGTGTIIPWEQRGL